MEKLKSKVSVIRDPEHRKTIVRASGSREGPCRVEVKVAPPGSLILAEVIGPEAGVTVSSTDPEEIIKTLLLYAGGDVSVKTDSFLHPVHANERGAAFAALAVEDAFDEVVLFVNGEPTDPRDYR